MARTTTKAGRVLIGSTALIAFAPGAEAVTIDTEPNDSLATAQPADAQIFGSLNEDPPSGDLTDVFVYTLTPGDLFDILVNPSSEVNHPILAEALSSVPAPLDSEVIPFGLQANLTGTVPADGKVFLRLTLQDEHIDAGHPSEGYNVTLTTQAAAVPLPASLALVAAGLVGVGGLHIARRRRAA
jgi:hypothetical protein